MTSTTARLTRTIATALVVAALPLGLSACSSDQAPPPSTTPALDGVGVQWSACMREGGFEVADVTDDEVRSGALRIPGGVDQGAFSARAADCSKQLGVQGTSDEQNQQWDREYAAVASCLRDNGYPDFPEQEPGSINVGDYARADEPQFEKVFDECVRKHSPNTQHTN